MLKILFGFEDSKLAVKNILDKLKSLGIPYETEVKYSKVSIKEFLHNHPDYNVVILKETVGTSKYTAEELAELADEREVNIIVVLGSEHKGQPYMQTLYSAGIVNAIFQEGRSGGGTVAGIVQLILQKRSRKEARAYYGIDTIEVGTLSNDAFAYYYLMYENKEFGMHLIERYLFVASKLSPLQNADFLRRLPKEQILELSNFVEFHQVLTAIKNVGVDVAKELKIKKPKKCVSVDTLPHNGPMIEAKANYTSGLSSSSTSFDGYDDADSSVFDFGLGEMFTMEESAPGSVEQAVTEEHNTPRMEDSIYPVGDTVISETSLPVDSSVGEQTTEDTASSAKKPKRVKGQKIKKEKVKKQKKQEISSINEQGSTIPTLEESTKGQRSFRWLLWAIPLALIVLVTIALATILIIYYIRY